MTSNTASEDGQHRVAPKPLLVALAVAATVFLVTTLEAASGPPASWEIDLFTTVNGLPDWLYAIIWPFMQYGVFVTIPIVATVAWMLKRRRLAALLAVSGVGIYLLAKVVKQEVERGRPAAFLEAINGREQFAAGSIGYTSGHAAVAATIATLTVAHLSRPWRWVTIGLVLIVAVGRMYVGAHLPLDLVGGIAMGVVAGSAALLLSGLLPARDSTARIAP